MVETVISDLTFDGVRGHLHVTGGTTRQKHIPLELIVTPEMQENPWGSVTAQTPGVRRGVSHSAGAGRLGDLRL